MFGENTVVFILVKLHIRGCPWSLCLTQRHTQTATPSFIRLSWLTHTRQGLQQPHLILHTCQSVSTKGMQHLAIDQPCNIPLTLLGKGGHQELLPHTKGWEIGMTIHHNHGVVGDFFQKYYKSSTLSNALLNLSFEAMFPVSTWPCTFDYWRLTWGVQRTFSAFRTLPTRPQMSKDCNRNI